MPETAVYEPGVTDSPPSQITPVYEREEFERPQRSSNQTEIVSNHLPAFTPEETAFIKYGLPVYPSEGFEELEQGNWQLARLGNVGGRPIYIFSDGEQSYAIKVAPAEIADFESLPSEIQNSEFLNPISKVAADNSFYGTRLLTGCDDVELFDRLGPAVYAQLAARVLIQMAEAKLVPTDIHFTDGHNAFAEFSATDDHQLQATLKLIDHDSYYYLPTSDSKSIIQKQLFKELKTALRPFFTPLYNDAFEMDAEGNVTVSARYHKQLEFLCSFGQALTQYLQTESVTFANLIWVPKRSELHRQHGYQYLLESRPLPKAAFSSPQALAQEVGVSIKNFVPDLRTMAVMYKGGGDTRTVSRQTALEAFYQEFGIQ